MEELSHTTIIPAAEVTTSTRPYSLKSIVNPKFHQHLDHVGAGLSFACALHCLLLPFVLGVLPLIGLGFLADHTAEIVFVTFSVIFASLSLCWGYRTHGKAHLFFVLFVSCGLIISGLIVAHSYHHVILVAAGAAGIALCHLLNKRLCSSCKSCHCTH